MVRVYNWKKLNKIKEKEFEILLREEMKKEGKKGCQKLITALDELQRTPK